MLTPFQPGTWVVLVLREPRERVWGRLLDMDVSGIALRGLDVRLWEDVIQLVMAGDSDQLALGSKFFPMHRVESLYLDEASSGAMSLVDDFFRRTGQHPAPLFEPRD